MGAAGAMGATGAVEPVLVVSAAEGALVICRARGDATALDAVQEELAVLLCAAE